MLVRIIQIYGCFFGLEKEINFRKNGLYMYLYNGFKNPPIEEMGGNLLSYSLSLEYTSTTNETPSQCTLEKQYG